MAGPAPAPLLRAETYYRYQIMLRAPTHGVAQPAPGVAHRALALPEDVTLAVDIDPVDLM